MAYTLSGGSVRRLPARSHLREKARPRTRSRSFGAGFSADVFALRVWEALGDATSLGLHSSASAGDWRSVVTHVQPSPSTYGSPYEFFLAYQASKLVSKMPGLPTGIDTRKSAEKRFIEAEASCLATNTRFEYCQMIGDYSDCTAVLHAVQRKIADILGPVPTFDALDFSFGPGANFGVRGQTTAYHKLTSALESTHSMGPLLSEFLAEFPGWVTEATADVALVNGSDLSFVPKDAKTERSICIEPLLNGLMQKGIGTYIRNRLLRHGINLRDQTINQRLAMSCEELGLSTVDFSSASDTIAYGLVWDLLPPDWCELLDSARCSQFRYEERWYPFQKFSSMGNAYTFELETLIFYSIAYSVMVEADIRPLTGTNLHVYGDDVIIPRGAYDRFKTVSTFCGFSINEQKSYKDGPFYESCGTDVFLGHLVTPFRLKVEPKTPGDLLYLANSLVRLSQRIINCAGTDAELAAAYKVAKSLASVHRWIIGLIPKRYRVFGPDNESDAWLICPFDRAVPSQGHFGWWHKRLVASPAKYTAPDGLWPMVYALYGVYRSSGPADIWDDSAPVLWSSGAALREKVRYRVGVTQSADWEYPPMIAGLFWQGY